MAETKKPKKHNWTTNGTTVDRPTADSFRRAIDACQHLTPASEAALENLLGVGTAIPDADSEPDPEYLAIESDCDEVPWDSDEPTQSELDELEAVLDRAEKAMIARRCSTIGAS